MSRPRLEPTAEQLRLLPTMSNSEAARQWGVHRQTVARWREDYGVPNPFDLRSGVAAEGRPVVVPRATVAPVVTLPADWARVVDPEAVWRTLKAWRRAVRSFDRRVEEAEATLPGDEPALVVFTSDWHVGHEQCDDETLERDLELVRSVPGVYLVTGGDLIDNVIASSPTGSHFEEIARPSVQKQLVEWLLQRVQGRVLAMCLGNHEARSIRDDDFDPISYLAHRLSVPYFGWYGVLTVHIGKQTYRLLVGHRFRMNSAFNRTHAAKRAMEFLADVDAVMLGDKHEVAAEFTHVRSRARWFAQAGTYLAESHYSLGKGYPRAIPHMPGIIVFPDKHEFVGHANAFVDGVHALVSYRRDLRDKPCPCARCAAAAS